MVRLSAVHEQEFGPMEDSQQLSAAVAAVRDGAQTGLWNEDRDGRAALVDEVPERRHLECGIQPPNLRSGQ